MFENIATHSYIVGSFNSLRRLEIVHSRSSFQFTANSSVQFDLLPNLEILCLRDLTMITCISGLAEYLGLKFRKLRCITVERCPKLKYLVPVGGLIPRLEQLREISVDSCEELEDLFRYDFSPLNQTSAPDAYFPSIQMTKLRNLPQLMGFCRLGVIAWPRMEKLEVLNCHTLRRVSAKNQNASTAQEI